MSQSVSSPPARCPALPSGCLCAAPPSSHQQEDVGEGCHEETPLRGVCIFFSICRQFTKFPGLLNYLTPKASPPGGVGVIFFY